MSNKNNTGKTFLELAAPWIRGYQIAVYLKGREKPATGLTVCSVQPGVLVARWKNSTHLIPLEAIAYIRFAPDCDPCREPTHPLHDLVQCHRPGDRRGQPPAKHYRQTGTSKGLPHWRGSATQGEQPYGPEPDVQDIADIIKNLRLPVKAA